MPRHPRDSDDPLQNQTFWTRRGGQDFSAEVDYDRPCPVCGYNLRGLPMRSRCPECGAIGGWNLYDDAVAWDESHTLGALLRPAASGDFSTASAGAARLVPAALGSGGGTALSAHCARHRDAFSPADRPFIVTLRATSIAAGWLSPPFDAAAIIVWLNAVDHRAAGAVEGMVRQHRDRHGASMRSCITHRPVW